MNQEETWALNIITAQTVNAQSELQRCIAARDSLIKLLEKKYKTIYNPETAKFEPKGKK